MRKAVVFMLIIALAGALCACQSGKLPTDNPEVNSPTLKPIVVDKNVTSASATDEYDAQNATYITLADGNIAVKGNGTLQGDNNITIKDAGIFVVSGKLSNGYILIDADKKDEVQLVLNGVDISCSSYAAISAMQSDKLTITLVTGSVNSLSDAQEYTVESEEANGCIFSNDNIIFNGGGSLNVTGNYNNAIASDDDLKFESGTYNLVCVNDALNANEKIRINGGTVNIDAGDDAIHADELLEVNGGTVNIVNSYEGLESGSITIAGGEISIVASDDGLNGAGGVDSSGTAVSNTDMGFARGRGGDKFASDGSAITISGGTVIINASGDGIDSNGDFTISGGEVYVSGPTNDGNAAIDYNGTATITGGVLIAAGSSGMAQNMSAAPEQCAVMIKYSTVQQSGAAITLKDASGSTVASYSPLKQYSSVVISAPLLVKDAKYTLYSNDEKLMEYTQSETVMSLDDSGNAVSGMGGMGGMGGGMGGMRPDDKQHGSQTNAPQPPSGTMTNNVPPTGGTPPTGGMPPTGGTPPTGGDTPPDGATPPEPPTGN